MRRREQVGIAAVCSRTHIASAMSIRKLFGVLVALAVLFAPAFSRAGEAIAAAPDHQAQMMEAGHCKSGPDKSADHDKAPKNCCISMCMAVAITPIAPVADTLVQRAPAVFANPAFHVGLPAEIATPPPRAA